MQFLFLFGSSFTQPRQITLRDRSFFYLQEIQESIKNREPQLNLIRKQSGEFVHRGRQIMEPYKRLLDRRWDDLSARIRELEEELEDTKKMAEEARAKGGRVETEIIVTVSKTRVT